MAPDTSHKRTIAGCEVGCPMKTWSSEMPARIISYAQDLMCMFESTDADEICEVHGVLRVPVGRRASEFSVSESAKWRNEKYRRNVFGSIDIIKEASVCREAGRCQRHAECIHDRRVNKLQYMPQGRVYQQQGVVCMQCLLGVKQRPGIQNLGLRTA